MRKIGNKAVAATAGAINGNQSAGTKALFNFGTAPHQPEWMAFEADKTYVFDIIPYVIESKTDPDVVNNGMEVGDIAAMLSLNVHRLGPDNVAVACPKNFRKGCDCSACAEAKVEWDKYRALNLTPKSQAAIDAAKIPKAYESKVRNFFWVRPYENRGGRWYALDQVKLVEMSPFYFTEKLWNQIQQKATFSGGNSGDVLSNFSIVTTPKATSFGKALDFSGALALEPRTGPDFTEEQEAKAFSLSKHVKVSTKAEIDAIMFGGDEEPATGYEEPAEEDRFNHQPKQATHAPGPDHTDFSVDFGDDKPATPAPAKAEAPKTANVGNLRFRDPCPVNAAYMFGRHFDQKPECASCAHRDACENAE